MGFNSGFKGLMAGPMETKKIHRVFRVSPCRSTVFFFFLAQKPKPGLDRLIFAASRLHTTGHTPGRTPLSEWSARRRGHYLHSTQQAQETNIHTLSGVRTHKHGSQAVLDHRLRPHCHRDRLCSLKLFIFVYFPISLFVLWSYNDGCNWPQKVLFLHGSVSVSSCFIKSGSSNHIEELVLPLCCRL